MTMRTILRGLYHVVDWLATKIVKITSPEFGTKGPFLPTRTQIPRSINLDGTPMLTETIDMKSKPYGF